MSDVTGLPLTPAQADAQDWQFVSGYVMATAPFVGAAALAPSPGSWAVTTAVVLTAVGAWVLGAREVRIRARAACPASAQVTGTEDSAQDSSGQVGRTAS